MTTTSLATMVLDRAERHPSRRVFQCKRREQWEDLSWQQLADQIVSAAHGLAALGFKAGDRLALLAENQPEWPIMDLACLYLGGVDVPLYLSSPGQDVAYILKDSGASFIAVSGRGQLDKVRHIAPDLPELSHVVALDPEDQPFDSAVDPTSPAAVLPNCWHSESSSPTDASRLPTLGWRRSSTPRAQPVSPRASC